MSLTSFIARVTPPGEAGIHIVWLWGLAAEEFLIHNFQNKKFSNLQPGLLLYGQLLVAGEVLDEVMVRQLSAQESFGLSRVFEVSLHGSMSIVQKLCESCVQQAISVIQHKDVLTQAVAENQLDPWSAEAWQYSMQATTQEATVFFLRHTRGELAQCLTNSTPQVFNELYRKRHIGMALAQPKTMVLIGKTNAGKSSLLNALLGYERVIVADVHGTTRDPIRERVSILGYPFTVIDTAGLRESQDELEQLSMQATNHWSKQADLLLWVRDGSVPYQADEQQLVDRFSPIPTILLQNKSDLGSAAFPNLNHAIITGSLREDPTQVVAQLSKQVLQCLDLPAPIPRQGCFLFSPKQIEIVERLRKGL